MADEKERPGWPFWAAVALLLPVAYVGSILPACWLSARFGGAKAVSVAFRPLTWTAQVIDVDGDRPWLKNAIRRYSEIGSGNWAWFWGNPGTAEWHDFLVIDLPLRLDTVPGFVLDESMPTDESESE